METRKLALRILYTVSGSQYILARSSSSVPVVLIPPTHTGYDHHPVTEQPETRPEFGTASLKTCLDAICISSPELVQNKRRDFSVYVLDPLESNSAPARVNIPNAVPSDSKSAPEHPRGLAVALGLMSWALMQDERDSTPVTGTVIKLPTGQEALEIIFALKETVAMEKSSLPAALRTWGLPPETPNSSSGSAVNAPTACNSHHPGSSERHDVYSSHQTHCSASQSTRASSSILMPSSSSLDHVPTDSATLATIASIHMRSQHKRAKAKAKKPIKTPSIDPENSEADRLLVSHYIGPERKKPGRPPNATASGSKSNKSSAANISEASSSTTVDSKTAGPSNSIEPRTHSRTAQPSHLESNNAKSHVKSSKEPPTHPFTSAPLIRSPRDPEPQSLLEILTFLSSSSSSSDPNVQNSALLAALNAIDSSQANGTSAGSEKPPGPLLVNALRELISAAAQRQAVPPSAPNNIHPPANNHNRNHLPDDDIVLLDKENVNPTVFRRRSEREGKLLDSDASTPATPSILSSGQSNTETPTTRGLTTRPNGNINTTPIPPALSAPPPNSTSSTRRKRTLSDFMDEREASKGKGKLRDREWVERRDSHRYAQSSPRRNELSSIRHYPRLVSDIAQSVRKASGSYYRTAETWSSPSKPSNGYHESDENSYQRPITITDSPGLPKVSASSPVRSVTTKFRKPYIVPAWARTSTSMQPRLSEDAAKALELAEAKKQEERKARKRGTLRVEKKKKRLAQSPSPSPRDTANRQKRPTPQTTGCPPPLTVASDGPMFAMAIQDRIAAFSSPVSSEPKSPRSGKPALPCTPPRKRNSDLFSPGEDGSLFTPVPGRVFSNMRTPASFEPARKLSLNTPKTPRASKKRTEDGNEASGEESEDELEYALNRELNNAYDELDMPSGSLPSVSSDVEMENETVSSNQEEVVTQSESYEDTDAEIPTKQHWVGLPPSSPPPPTSPLLMPQDDESDDTMLPAVTSDADPCPTDSEVPSDSNCTNELSTCTDEELVEYLESDFASIFATPLDQSTFGNDSTRANMDLFDQFNNYKAQSDGGEQNTVLDPNFDALQEGLVDFDLTEFWETFKPLLQDQSGNVGDSADEVPGQVVDNQVFDPMNFDHMKLAEDIQALFSGCVV
ncbi:hypothetical protein H2248_004914 [Termitomyces sp. 'cryptogamus']|nr:hypothetical protein H2248_004914 [Termitomyces sp. 'cryptogamus']